MQSLPEVLGAYRVIKELGRGATGTVFLAHHESLGREVALKMLSSDFLQDADSLERFRREGKIAAKLRNSHIVQVYDFFEHEGRYLIAMEYLGSRTLEGLIRERGPLPLRDALRLTDQLLDALDHAHGLGVVHRDIKPANVMITDSHCAALTDFSIAHMKSQSKLTQAGTVVGTPEYMAPEQFDGLSDARSDLYATGLILYEMLTGFAPFRADTITEIMKKQIMVLPDPPTDVDFTIPVEVSNAILKSLAKKPEERYASAQEMRLALRKGFQASQLPQSAQAPVAPTTRQMGSDQRVTQPPPVRVAPVEPSPPLSPAPIVIMTDSAPMKEPQPAAQSAPPAAPEPSSAEVALAADQLLEQQGLFWLKRASLASLALLFLAGHLPHLLAVIPLILGYLGAFGLMASGPIFAGFLLVRKRPLRQALAPVWISLALAGGFLVVAVLNSMAS